MHTYNLFINLTPNNPDVLDLSYTPISIQDARAGTYLQCKGNSDSNSQRSERPHVGLWPSTSY